MKFRAQENRSVLAGLGQKQTVDFTHNVAIVHGLNTISQSERVILELRYTDVYTKDGNTWRPISAQETPIEGSAAN